MRVLFITPYITNPADSSLMRNTTGFGFMVNDIAKYAGKKSNITVFPVNAFVPQLSLDGFKIDKWSKLKLIKSVSFNAIRKAMQFLNKYPVPLKERLRIIYQFIAVFSRERVLRGFDLVHIHGCTPITAAAIDLCKRHNKPFVVTLHGLVSFEDSVRLHPSLKRFEKDFLMDAYRNDYYLTFISTGNMKQALEFVSHD